MLPGKDDLPERIHLGEEDAFEEFRIRYSRRLYGMFRRLGLSDADAADRVVDCCTDIPLKAAGGQFTLGTNFEAWVFRVARNCALAWARKERRVEWLALREEQAATPLPEESLVSLTSNRGAVTEALNSLDAIDRRIIDLRYRGYETPSFAAIAGDLSTFFGKNFKEATIRQRHGRALSKIEAFLKGTHEEEKDI